MYTAYYLRMPKNKETGKLQCRCELFGSLDTAIQFAKLEAMTAKDVCRIGAHIEDENGKCVYEMIFDGTECYPEQEIAI